MQNEHVETRHSVPRIGWFGGMALYLIVLLLGTFVPAFIVYQLWFNLELTARTMTTGLVAANGLFIVVMRFGYRRGWWQ